MALFDYIFRRGKESSAAKAKDRLQIIVARERSRRRNGSPDYLPQLQQELLQVIAKYESIDIEKVSVNLEDSGDCEVLELNISLPEPEKAPTRGRQHIRRAEYNASLQ